MIQLIIVDYLSINILGRGLAPNSLSELYEQVVLTNNIYKKFI